MLKSRPIKCLSAASSSSILTKLVLFFTDHSHSATNRCFHKAREQVGWLATSLLHQIAATASCAATHQPTALLGHHQQQQATWAGFPCTELVSQRTAALSGKWSVAGTPSGHTRSATVCSLSLIFIRQDWQVLNQRERHRLGPDAGFLVRRSNPLKSRPGVSAEPSYCSAKCAPWFCTLMSHTTV